MHEILFRGKRADNGEWVYGDLIHRQIWKRSVPVIIRNHDDGFDQYEEYEIDPSSVGQYTGLNDRNNEKIFDGDIVEYPIEQGKYQEKNNIHEVVFEKRHGTAYFGIKMSEIETWGFDLSVPAKLMQIIGNIYDNPELLKGEQ